MLSIDNVVNVQLNVTPSAEPQRKVDILAVFSEDWATSSLSADAYAEFTSQEDVELVFAASTETAKLTSLFFQQTPRPKMLVIAPYDKVAVAGCTDAMTALNLVYKGWYAAYFTSNIPLAQLEAVVAAVTTQKKIAGTTTNSLNDLNKNEPTNVFKKVYAATQNRLLAVYHSSNKYAAVSALATMLSVNWEGTKTKKTLKFKVAPGVIADDLVQTVYSDAKALGINIYAYFGSSPMFAEGHMVGRRFFDEIHGLDWFVDAVQKNVFNALYQSPTQIDLTDAGTAKLVARVKEAARKGVQNGLFAPGVWRIDGFGALERGDFLDEGFYVWADSVATLSDTDVENRQAPVIYCAVKLAGAVHGSDIIIGFSR